MKKKSPSQRANEFSKKSIIKNKFKNLHVTDNDIKKLEYFFEKYMQTYEGEISDSVYCTVGNLLQYHDNINLFDYYQKLKTIKVGSFEHYTTLFGSSEGEKRYNKKREILSEKLSLDSSDRVNAFLQKKCVSSILDKESLSEEQLMEMDSLFKSRNYNDFKDNESIVIDLVLNFKPNFVERYNTIKAHSVKDIDYYKARYGHNYYKKFSEYKNKKKQNAITNFANCEEYWTAQGLTHQGAQEQIHKVQKNRAKKAKIILSSNGSPRTIKYWIEKGLSVEESKKIVRDIQARDLEFYINKYGNEIGTYKYQKSIQKKLVTWFNRSEEERKKINQTKGRTYADLIFSFGVDAANEIIKNRTKKLPSISKESIDFFRYLDENLHDEISSKSITGYKSPEMWVKTLDNMYFLDYVVGNCVIEYNGSFWHCDSRLFKYNDWNSGLKKFAKDVWEYDTKKIDSLKNLGYNVLTIWSHDADENYEKEIKKCKDFLNEHLQNTDKKSF